MGRFQTIVEYVVYGIETFGVLVIVLGCLAGTWRLVRGLGRRAMLDIYTQYRQDIARSILLGLEFLIAADVIRTVLVAPTLANVAVLALIVLIRTFLSFSLTMEIEGRLPWQRRPDGRDGQGNQDRPH